jgi:hypothetical protein
MLQPQHHPHHPHQSSIDIRAREAHHAYPRLIRAVNRDTRGGAPQERGLQRCEHLEGGESGWVLRRDMNAARGRAASRTAGVMLFRYMR